LESPRDARSRSTGSWSAQATEATEPQAHARDIPLDYDDDDPIVGQETAALARRIKPSPL